MGGIKQKYSLELNEDQMEWLQKMVSQYALDDEGKALRIILDYVQDEADLDTVFEVIRCNHCD